MHVKEIFRVCFYTIKFRHQKGTVNSLNLDQALLIWCFRSRLISLYRLYSCGQLQVQGNQYIQLVNVLYCKPHQPLFQTHDLNSNHNFFSKSLITVLRNSYILSTIAVQRTAWKFILKIHFYSVAKILILKNYLIV